MFDGMGVTDWSYLFCRKTSVLAVTKSSSLFTLRSIGEVVERYEKLVVIIGRIGPFGRTRSSLSSSSSSSVICQTTGPNPLPKRFLHIV